MAIIAMASLAIVIVSMSLRFVFVLGEYRHLHRTFHLSVCMIILIMLYSGTEKDAVLLVIT